MRITWKSTHYGQVGLHAELDEYDATPPVDALLMDHAPMLKNPEREGIAAYLAFGRWVSGDLALPHKIGPNTAAAIERDLELVHVRPRPIEYYPKPLEIGVREVSVHFEHAGDSCGSSITVLPASRWSGSIRGLQSVSVASNAIAFDDSLSGSFRSVRARLAIAVLFAADVSANTLVVRGDLIAGTERHRIEALLLSTRLGVRYT